MLTLRWLHFASLRNRLGWNIPVCDRYPPAAVDSSKSCAPAGGGGAHQSGVPGPNWALRRKWYLPRTTGIHLFLIKCIQVCSRLPLCVSKVGRPSCTLRPILLQPSSSTSSCRPEEAGLSLMVRPTLAFSARFLSRKRRRRRRRQRFCKALMSTQRDDEPSFLWQVCFHQPVFLFCLCFCPLCQDSSTRSWGANWPSASRPTLSTGTRQPRRKWLKSVAWRGSTIRSSSRIYSLRPVRIVNVLVHYSASQELPNL